MEPIVSPWFIYFIDHVLGTVMFLKGILLVAIVIITIAFVGETSDGRWNEESAKNAKTLKKYLIGTIITLLILSVVPSKEVAYKMFIASYLTPDNLNLGKEMTKDGIEWLLNQIVEAVNKIK